MKARMAGCSRARRGVCRGFRRKLREDVQRNPVGREPDSYQIFVFFLSGAKEDSVTIFRMPQM